jgi:hypothetical protein
MPESLERKATATITAQEVWELRHKALSLALVGSYANFNADAVINRAQAFEGYMLNGGPETVQITPTINEQIASAFVNLTGSLDGNLAV